MDRSSPGQAMQVPDHNGLGYPARPASSEHPRPRTLQRHHTIQNSDDAYVSGKSPVPNSSWVCMGYGRGDTMKGSTQLCRAAGDELLLGRSSQHAQFA